ncbi:MAG: hypothetical protein H0V17_36500, partial [Deltaproteobacteria bacterium]|nr:hypothetical protein [Deltaproteobacteria bacterium]
LEVDPYFVRYRAPGDPETLLVAPLPEGFSPGEPVQPDSEIQVYPRPAPTLRSAFSEPSAYAGSYNRVGGVPSWIQPPRVIRCPQCDDVMMFIAQASDLPGEWAEFLFAFECRRCQVVATTLERG